MSNYIIGFRGPSYVKILKYLMYWLIFVHDKSTTATSANMTKKRPQYNRKIDIGF